MGQDDDVLRTTGERRRLDGTVSDTSRAVSIQGGVAMSSVAKITELSVRSEESFKDAVQVGIARANKTLRNVQGAWVKEMKVDVTDGEIVAYQVILEVTFVLDD
jgi:flavin-binding protein dodecin